MPERRRVAITVKTYPNPSTKYGETVCIAGVDLALGQMVRLYPIRFRDLPYEQSFKKWEVVEADMTHKDNDARGDTYTPAPDAPIKTVDAFCKGSGKKTRPDWSRRDALALPLARSLEDLQVRADKFEGSLGLVRVTEDAEFYMQADAPEWTERQLAIMNQESLFGSSRKPLEKIPWKFRYKFRCADSPECPGHDLQVFDWEPYELYRGQWHQHGPEKAYRDVLDQYNNRYGTKNRNVHLWVGTTVKYPTQFSCVGVYYPPNGG
jgi:hypothetical protein